MNISLTFHNTSKFQKPDKLHSPMNLSENISSKSKVYASIPDELIPLRLKKISPSSLAHFFLEYPEERHTFLHYFEKFSKEQALACFPSLSHKEAFQALLKVNVLLIPELLACIEQSHKFSVFIQEHIKLSLQKLNRLGHRVYQHQFIVDDLSMRLERISLSPSKRIYEKLNYEFYTSQQNFFKLIRNFRQLRTLFNLYSHIYQRPIKDRLAHKLKSTHHAISHLNQSMIKLRQLQETVSINYKLATHTYAPPPILSKHSQGGILLMRHCLEALSSIGITRDILDRENISFETITQRSLNSAQALDDLNIFDLSTLKDYLYTH